MSEQSKKLLDEMIGDGVFRDALMEPYERGGVMKFELDTGNFPEYLIDADHRWGFEVRMANTPYYCGKLLVLENCENSSIHYHKVKTETFIILSGVVQLTFWPQDDTETIGLIKGCIPGDRVTLHRLQKHVFRAVGGPALILEVSTHHEDADTYRVG